MSGSNDSDSTMAPPVLTPQEIDKFAEYFDMVFADLIKKMEPYPDGSGRFSVTQEFTIGGINAFELARRRLLRKGDDDEEELDEEETNSCIKFAKFLILITWINDPYGVMYEPKIPEKPAPNLIENIEEGIELEKEARAMLMDEIEKARISGKLKKDKVLAKAEGGQGPDGPAEKPEEGTPEAGTPETGTPAEKTEKGEKVHRMRVPGL